MTVADVAVLTRWPVRRWLALLLILTLPLFTFEIISLATLRHEREAEIREDARRLLSLVVAEQQRIVEDIRHVLVALSEMGIGHMDPPTCQATMARIRQLYPSYMAIHAADTAGSIWCSTEPAALDVFAADAPHRWAAVNPDRIITGQVTRSSVTGKPVIPFARAYRGKDASQSGFVVVFLDIVWLEQYLTQKALPAGASVLIADKVGAIIAQVPAIPNPSGDVLPERFRSFLNETVDGIVEGPDPDGVLRVTAYSPTPAGVPGLYIQVGLDKASAMRPANAAALHSLLIFIGLVLLTGGAAIWGFRWFLKLRDEAQRSTLRTAAVLASTEDGVIEFDREWRFTYLNDKARDLVSQGRDLLGRTLWEAFPELVNSALWEKLHWAMAERKPTDLEFQGVRTRLWFWVRAFPSPNGLAIYLLDITRRRKAEDDLRESTDRLNLALQSAQAGTFDWDLGTGQGHWSEETYRIFGLDPHRHSPDNETWLTIVHPDDVETATLLGQAQYLAERRPDFYLEYRVVHPNGGVRWVASIGRVRYAADGTPLRFSGLNIDITERKAMEEALREAKAEADAANVSKSRFLAAASHDLRQPLQSALLFSGVLRHRFGDAQDNGSLTSLERALETLKNLLDSLLDVSRLDAGGIVPQIADIPLAPLLDEISAAYAPVAASKGLAFQVEPPRSVLAVSSDRLLLERMVRNLVENAIRYTERGHVRITCEATRGGVRITVEDSGIGIPPDHLERIWEEFHQVGNPERDRSQGLGLGLAIVRRLSTLLRHPIAIRSKPGKGSVFSIELPRATGPAAAVESSVRPAANAGGRGRLAVLIDDDAIVLDGLGTLFREWGYDVIIAGSLEQALVQLRTIPRAPDLIVADHRLRDQTVGTDAIVSIRERVGESVPGIILTGDIGGEYEQEAAALGLVVVHKPIAAHQLSLAVRQALEEDEE